MKIIIFLYLIRTILGYEDIRDEFNYDMYSQNISLLQKHLNCYIDKGPCDTVSQSVKPHLFEVFSDACRECNNIQKHHGHQFVKALKDLQPEGYKQFMDKYDKDGTHFSAFEAAVANY